MQFLCLLVAALLALFSTCAARYNNSQAEEFIVSERLQELLKRDHDIIKELAKHRPLQEPQRNLTAYEFELGRRGVRYSAAAYEKNKTLENWTCGPCQDKTLPPLTDIRIFYAEPTATYGYLGLDNDNNYIVVAFQGTSNLQQWIDDLSYFKADLNYPGAPSNARVHGGFLRSYQYVQSYVDKFVGEALERYPGYRILVTGHSLGAALATFCSLDLSLNFPSARINHYTFGQPRVGNEAFAQFHNHADIEAVYRFVHNRDIVPHLPLIAMGFYHTATEVFYLEDYKGPSSLTICDGSGEDPNCSDQFWVTTSIHDHQHYLGYYV